MVGHRAHQWEALFHLGLKAFPKASRTTALPAEEKQEGMTYVDVVPCRDSSSKNENSIHFKPV